MSIALSSGIVPVFAEVTEFKLDRETYLKDESINVTGAVTNDSTGLVTIVLRDPKDTFVLLSQAIIRADNSFEKTIPIKEKFSVTGTYNATAFVLNMTAGKTQSFELVETISDDNLISNENLVVKPSEFDSKIKAYNNIISLLNEELIKLGGASLLGGSRTKKSKSKK